MDTKAFYGKGKSKAVIPIHPEESEVEDSEDDDVEDPDYVSGHAGCIIDDTESKDMQMLEQGDRDRTSSHRRQEQEEGDANDESEVKRKQAAAFVLTSREKHCLSQRAVSDIISGVQQYQTALLNCLRSRITGAIQRKSRESRVN
ncbi:hypothetical protein ROHU_002305 [Labeo rohita]|nr:hypothetical protein ROHU_002305 [Labeo rohita]